MVDKAHRHVRGHSHFSDIDLSLMRNNFWNESVKSSLTDTVQTCHGCRHTFLLLNTRQGSLSSINQSGNETLCTHHFYSALISLFDVIDSTTRYCSSVIVISLSMTDAALAFESC